MLKLLRQWEEEGKKFLMNEIDRPAAEDFFLPRTFFLPCKNIYPLHTL